MDAMRASSGAVWLKGRADRFGVELNLGDFNQHQVSDRECDEGGEELPAEARSARYSLKNERPMLTNKVMPMMMACVRSPRKKDSTPVTARIANTALLTWRARTAIALMPWVRTEFGPIEASLVFASTADSPSLDEPNHR